MPANERDDSREERIDLEIVVDAYNKEERAMGWYYYLDNHLNFPFKALWTSRRRTSSLTSETVEVVGMSPEEYCSEEMFVELLYKEGTVEDTFSVPLCDIEAIDADPTQAAIADWHYWVDQGYQF
jgi:hypothetical protein